MEADVRDDIIGRLQNLAVMLAPIEIKPEIVPESLVRDPEAAQRYFESLGVKVEKPKTA